MRDTAASLPAAEIEHRIPGRMRLRVRARRGDIAFFQNTEAALAELPGVRRVRANAQTAGILVEHGGDAADVLAAARARRLFTPEPPRERALAVATARAGARVAAAPLNLAAFGLAGAGLLQLARGQVVGSASENLWNAYGLYAVTRRALPAALLVAFGLFQIARGEVLGSATSLFLYAFSARQMARHSPARDIH